MIIKSIISVIRSFAKKLSDDYIGAFAAQAAFYIFVSFFPFIMFLMALMRYMPFSQAEVLNVAESIFPSLIGDSMSSLISDMLSQASGTVISITVIATVWSASKGFMSIVNGFNSIYKNAKKRNYFIRRLLSALYTILFAVMLIVVLVIFVFGNQLYQRTLDQFPVVSDFALLVISIRTIVGICVMILFFCMIYVFVPDRKTHFLYELPGAIVSSLGWVLFSYFYSLYVDRFASHSYVYGSLTTIVLLMLWLYACMYIMFFGAELNQTLAIPLIRRCIADILQKKKKKQGRSKIEKRIE